MKSQKDINFEINLLPVISLLAVCISFLLLTTVWIHIGTLDVKQALGEASQEEQKEEPPALWVTMIDSGDIVFQVRNSKDKGLSKPVRFSRPDKGSWDVVSKYAVNLRERAPDIDMALVLPDRNTSYDVLIKTLDLLKEAEFKDLGIAPL